MCYKVGKKLYVSVSSEPKVSFKQICLVFDKSLICLNEFRIFGGLKWNFWGIFHGFVLKFSIFRLYFSHLLSNCIKTLKPHSIFSSLIRFKKLQRLLNSKRWGHLAKKNLIKLHEAFISVSWGSQNEKDDKPEYFMKNSFGSSLLYSIHPFKSPAYHHDFNISARQYLYLMYPHYRDHSFNMTRQFKTINQYPSWFHFFRSSEFLNHSWEECKENTHF